MTTDGFTLSGFLFIHEAMRRDTRRLAAACAAATTDDQLRALGRWFARFEMQLEDHHHAEDEVYFPRLRAGDPELAAGLDSLGEDHHELAASLAAVKAAFAALDRAALVTATAQLAELLDRHLADEEALAVPATVRLMSADEQRALEDGLRKKSRLSQIAFGLPWIITAIPDGERAALMKQLPLPLRVLHDTFWRRSYERLAAPLALGR
jgi:hemerythrin-like domain-containing protein